MVLMSEPIFLKRIVLNNYKSIRACSVRLGPLTFLLGQNGSGKSNFLDAVRLVTDALNTSLEHALRDRGGINEVRRRSSGHPTHFGIRLKWELPNRTEGVYSFRVGSKSGGAFEVQQEECRIYSPNSLHEEYYKVESGKVTARLNVTPPASEDRLYLVAAAGLPPFRPLFDALSHMGFYNFNPDEIREMQRPDPGEVLKRDGSNLASVLSVIERKNKDMHARIVDFLSRIVPGITNVEVRHAGKKETLEFGQQVGTNRDAWRFIAENMSDGTLRALGILTALFQSVNGGQARVPFVAIEEPEVALHPGAAGVVRDALKVAARTTQVVVTSHSPELLDDKELSKDNILSVEIYNGETTIGPIDVATTHALRDKLYTAGELLRLNQIESDKSVSQDINQIDLFSGYTPSWK
jgi:predicted ATPase